MMIFQRDVVLPWYVRQKSDRPSVSGGNAGLQFKVFNAGSGGSYEMSGRTFQILFNGEFVWEITFIWRWDMTLKRWKETNAEGRARSRAWQATMRGADEYTSWNWIKFPSGWPELSGFNNAAESWHQEEQDCRQRWISPYQQEG